MTIRAIFKTELLVLIKAVAVSATGLAAAEFPTPYNSEQGNPAPMSAADALAKITLPPGLQATLFAAEPELQNPIALDFDARGRVWVAENDTYAERALRFDLGLRDRILIFDDTDGDGRADSRKVFSDTLQPLTSIARVPGGVWAMCPPQLVFIPDADGDDVPDGPPVVALDGFTVAKENYHGLANGLKFGPDGWLYGRCGASCPGDIAVPGTLPEQRVPMRGGLWRYHPQRQVFEALTHGTTNPWGHDWDAHGELFFVNTVNGHLWHMITGAHFVRSHTLDPHPHSYALIDMHADHWHFDTGKSWAASRDGAANELGGGHSHEGALIYQGGNWPTEFHGKLLTINFHGRRTFAEEPGQPRTSASTKEKHPLTEVGGPIPRVEGGPFSGYSAELDGKRYFKIPYAETGDLNISGKDAQVSMFAVVRIIDLNQSRTIAGMWSEGKGKGDDSGTRQYALLMNMPTYGGPRNLVPHISSEGGVTYRADGSKSPWCADYAVSRSQVPEETWCSLGFTYDGNHIRAYVNGVMEERPLDPVKDKRTDRYFTHEGPDGGDRGMNPHFHGRGIFRYDPALHARTKPGGGSDFTVGARYAVDSILDDATKGRFGGLAVFNRALTDAEMKRLHDSANIAALK